MIGAILRERPRELDSRLSRRHEPRAKKTPEPMCESQQGSEHIWNPEVRSQLALDQIDAHLSPADEEPPKLGRASYRLDWLTATGLLIARVAIAFALDRTLF